MGGEGVWEGYGDLHAEKTTRLASWVGMGGDRAGIDGLRTDSQLGYIACTSDSLPTRSAHPPEAPSTGSQPRRRRRRRRRRRLSPPCCRLHKMDWPRKVGLIPFDARQAE
jgi:hypothetical protein